MNPQILIGQSLVVGVNGLDADGVTKRPLGSASVTISDYVSAFVAKIQPDNNAQLYFNIVPKVQPAVGQVITITCIVHSTSQDGSALPPQSIDVDLVGPPAPPQAANSQLVPTTPSAQWATSSVDPGSPTAILL